MLTSTVPFTASKANDADAKTETLFENLIGFSSFNLGKHSRQSQLQFKGTSKSLIFLLLARVPQALHGRLERLYKLVKGSTIKFITRFARFFII